jgi:hypothetical protein
MTLHDATFGYWAYTSCLGPSRHWCDDAAASQHNGRSFLAYHTKRVGIEYPRAGACRAQRLRHIIRLHAPKILADILIPNERLRDYFGITEACDDTGRHM